MLKMLRGGRAIWYADQDYGAKQSLFVPLFGIPAATVTATTSSPAWAGRGVAVHPEPSGHGSGYRLTIHPPLEDFPGESEEPIACGSTSGSSVACASSRAVPVGAPAFQDPPARRSQALSKRRKR